MHIVNKDFKRGFASAFSFAVDNRIRERIPMLSAEDRIRQSWESVGKSLRVSMGKVDKELKHDKKNT